MMKHIIILTFCLLALVACSKGDDNGWIPYYPTEEQNTTSLSYFEISHDSLSLPSYEVKESFYIATNEPWSADATESWVTLSATKGTHSETVEILIAENLIPQERQCIISVTGSNSSMIKQIIIRQEGANIPKDGGVKIHSYNQEIDFDASEDTSIFKQDKYWADGDKLYIIFDNNGDNIPATATYNIDSYSWSFEYSKTPEISYESNCFIWYGAGIESNESIGWINYRHMNEAYSTRSGHYSFDGNSIRLNAEVFPVGFRLRFKGEKGREIALLNSSILKYQGFDKEELFFQTQEEAITLTVDEDGYTDYVICKTPDESTILAITDLSTGNTYSRTFDRTMLKEGESGLFNLPTEENIYGWTLANCASGSASNYDYIDLGLPNGVKWATQNVGAWDCKTLGNYYAWGETIAKNTYTATNYTYSGTEDLSNETDAAVKNWGQDWRIPSRAEYLELTNHTYNSHITIQDITGRLFLGKNGKAIFLPEGGIYDGNSIYGDYCRYWTSTGLDEIQAYVFCGDSCFPDLRYLGYLIRPVLGKR